MSTHSGPKAGLFAVSDCGEGKENLLSAMIHSHLLSTCGWWWLSRVVMLS